MLPYLFAVNNHNYSKWLPVYILDMTALPLALDSLWDEWSKIIFCWTLLIISFFGTKTKINILAKKYRGGYLYQNDPKMVDRGKMSRH